MNPLSRIRALPFACVLSLTAAAQAQFSMPWYSIDGGGGVSTGGSFTLMGQVGQPDTACLPGGGFSIAGGVLTTPSCATLCYPNCDGSTTPPVLNVLDFACFINRYGSGDTYANCDNSTIPPVLNVLDFACFLNRFAAGCP